MQEQQFVSAVKESLDLPDNRSAERAVKATLTVLGQRLEGGEAKDLASQLPGGLADALPNEGAGERFDVDTFYQRIAEQEGEGVTVAQARQHARAIAKGLESRPERRRVAELHQPAPEGLPGLPRHRPGAEPLVRIVESGDGSGAARDVHDVGAVAGAGLALAEREGLVGGDPALGQRDLLEAREAHALAVLEDLDVQAGLDAATRGCRCRARRTRGRDRSGGRRRGRRRPG